MFWKKADISKPTSVPSLVGKRIVEEMQKMPHTSDHWVKLKGVMRQHGNQPDAFDIRVYDEWEADQKKLKVENWVTLDQHPDLIQYEGWFDKKSKKVEIAVKQPAPAPAQPKA